MTCKPERNLGARELAAVHELLPERSRVGGRKGLEGKTHDAGDVTLEEAARHLLDNEERLWVHGEARHGYGVLGKDAGDRATSIVDGDELTPSSRVSDLLDGRRLGGVEGRGCAA